MLIVPHLADHSFGDRRPGISVDLGEDPGRVELTLNPEYLETMDDLDVIRQLTTDEARALSAALVHYADRAER